MSTPTDMAIQLCWLVFVLSLPAIAVASVAGLLVSLFQAVTQLQEQTFSFGIKLAAVIGTLLSLSNWMGGALTRFSQNIFDNFYLLAR